MQKLGNHHHHHQQRKQNKSIVLPKIFKEDHDSFFEKSGDSKNGEKGINMV